MGSTNRSVIIAGNWKMFKTIPESISYLQTLLPALTETTVETYLAVPLPPFMR